MRPALGDEIAKQEHTSRHLSASNDIVGSFKLSVPHGWFAVADLFEWFRRFMIRCRRVPMVPCRLRRNYSKVIPEQEPKTRELSDEVVLVCQGERAVA